MTPEQKAKALIDEYGIKNISEIISWIIGMKKLHIYNSYTWWNLVITELKGIDENIGG